MKEWTIKDKYIWLTGASSGIGEALALALNEAGAWVAISARHEENLKAVRAKMSSPEHCLVLPCDVADREANLKAIDAIHQHWGNLDAIILNAGSCIYVDTQDFSSQAFEKMIQINYLSVIYGVEASLPLLRASKSAYIVGMSSIAGHLGLPRSEAYSAAKAATRIFLQGLRTDLFAENIAVSIICPGFIDTPLTQRNDFAMPCLTTPSRAAKAIVKGLQRQTHEIHFPKCFTRFVKCIAFLPTAWSLPLLAKLSRVAKKK